MAKEPRMILNQYHKDFIKQIEQAAKSRSMIDVFGDAVHMMAQAMWKPFALGAAEKVEADWQSTRDRYDNEAYAHIVAAFGVVQQALEAKREEFLGAILEEIGAANVRNGQFLTPASVAGLMARVNAADRVITPGHIVTLDDPACGASVLLIAGAEALRERGARQCDIFVTAGDVDLRVCDMSYVELTLLGYAARVDHMDALSRKVFSPPRFTAGYFIHAMPMRLS